LLSALTVGACRAIRVSVNGPEGLPAVTPEELARGPLNLTPDDLAQGPQNRPDLVGVYAKVFCKIVGSGRFLHAGHDVYVRQSGSDCQGRCFWVRVDSEWGLFLPDDGCWLAGRVGTDAEDFPLGLLGYGGYFCKRLPPRREWVFVLDTRAAPQDPALEPKRAEERREWEAFMREVNASMEDGTGGTTPPQSAVGKEP
jgi:hypothetical protein